MLADEPTGNLDPELSAEIMKLFREFNNAGVTVLIATHDLALIAKMPHRSLILRNGQLVGSQLMKPNSITAKSNASSGDVNPDKLPGADTRPNELAQLAD